MTNIKTMQDLAATVGRSIAKTRASTAVLSLKNNTVKIVIE